MPVFVQCLQQVAVLDLAIAACTALLLSFRLDRKHWDTFLLVQHHGLAETRARRSLLGGQRESVRIRDLSRLPKTGGNGDNRPLGVAGLYNDRTPSAAASSKTARSRCEKPANGEAQLSLPIYVVLSPLGSLAGE